MFSHHGIEGIALPLFSVGLTVLVILLGEILPKALGSRLALPVALGGGRNAGAFVAKAEGVALPAGDRAGFEQLLRQALAASDARRDLQNEAMRARALWLLDSLDDLF